MNSKIDMKWFHEQLKLVRCDNVDGRLDVTYEDCYGVKVVVKGMVVDKIPNVIEKFEVLNIDDEVYFVVGKFNVRCDEVCINCG